MEKEIFKDCLLLQLFKKGSLTYAIAPVLPKLIPTIGVKDGPPKYNRRYPCIPPSCFRYTLLLL